MDLPVGLPEDPPRLGVLLLLPLAAWLLPRFFAKKTPPRFTWVVAPLGAAALSAAYVHYYLRGGPRIIDATAYWLEARALSHGMLAFPIGDPEQSVLGRFLLRTTVDGQPAASVIFPVGWPAVLALGFLAHAPMWVGPILAAAIVLATMDLARTAARLAEPALEAPIVRIAAVLSVVCAALRYHTADTMSHGLAALSFTLALAAALRIAQGGSTRAGAVLGLAGGILFATRPASAFALAVAVLAGGLRGGERPPRRALVAASLAALPAVVLFFLHQRAATGGLSSTAQTLYYAQSDGPPGCFGYGFAAELGCRGEHGDFLDRYVPHGWSLVAALGTTGRRLLMHLPDALGLAPLLLLVPIGAVAARRAPLRMLALAPVAQILLYAPFYFDGNYPGAGGRMYADVLPIEHVLAVLGLVAVQRRLRRPTLATAAALVVVLGLGAFAFHLGRLHADLRARDGGLPMLEPSRLAGLDRALVLVDTDQGFDLGFDPASGPLVVRRHRGDAHDWLAWDALGRPPAYRYRYTWSPGAAAEVWIEPYEPDPPSILEGESLWPAMLQVEAWAWPVHASASCISRGRVIRVEPTGMGSRVELRLPRSLWGFRLSPRVLGPASATISVIDGGRALERWEIAVETADCTTFEPAGPMPAAINPRLRIEADTPVLLDALLLDSENTL
jgi:hypothetical protein